MATQTVSVDSSYHGGDGDAVPLPIHSVPIRSARSVSQRRTVPSVSTIDERGTTLREAEAGDGVDIGNRLHDSVPRVEHDRPVLTAQRDDPGDRIADREQRILEPVSDWSRCGSRTVVEPHGPFGHRGDRPPSGPGATAVAENGAIPVRSVSTARFPGRGSNAVRSPEANRLRRPRSHRRLRTRHRSRGSRLIPDDGQPDVTASPV